MRAVKRTGGAGATTGDPSIRGCHHVHLYAPARRPGTHATPCHHPGWFDRSRAARGRAARMAQLHARGELPLHTSS
ncbi:proline racemase family protein [Streptomyces echinatus]|uniref:proline racemase family protein n=1 Tax=Streptomyces echinatus TaxID=67293 RepID=UPI0031EBA7A4